MTEGVTRLQAGAVVVRVDREEVHYLLVTSRRDPDNWIFPKGNLDPGETVEDAALREAEEEAGVTGRLLARVGSTAFKRNGIDFQVEYFVLEAENDGGSREGRQVAWLTFEQAEVRLGYPGLRQRLAEARAVLERHAED